MFLLPAMCLKKVLKGPVWSGEVFVLQPNEHPLRLVKIDSGRRAKAHNLHVLS